MMWEVGWNMEDNDRWMRDDVIGMMWDVREMRVEGAMMNADV
jgi:hypothetical protein